jgi:diadenosine tetraphosphatase ApaH/serine/threonine PP2A family protein phosphatase
MEKLGVDEVLCAGDIVGYGGNPVECVELVRSVASAVVAGNHEMGVLSEESSAFFNRVAREACVWTRENLGASELTFLGGLGLVQEFADREVTLVHAEVRVPGLFDYIQGFYDVTRNMSVLAEGRICFFGHSHAPFVFHENGGVKYSEEPEVVVEAGRRALVNVGSVGQPRDGDPRSCFVTLDTEERRVRFHRVWYDVEEAGQAIRKVGLPRVLADRLRFGR